MPRYGFIREKLDIKILILFILRRLPAPVDAATLCDLVNCDDGIDYFDYTECLEDLVRTGHVSESDESYVITDKGRKNGEYVESSLPYSVRIKAEKSAVPVAERLSRMAMITARHENTESGCMLVVGMSDGKGEIFSSRLLVPDEEQDKKMEKKFRLGAEKIYTEVIKLISGEQEQQDQ